MSPNLPSKDRDDFQRPRTDQSLYLGCNSRADDPPKVLIESDKPPDPLAHNSVQLPQARMFAGAL